MEYLTNQVHGMMRETFPQLTESYAKEFQHFQAEVHEKFQTMLSTWEERCQETTRHAFDVEQTHEEKFHALRLELERKNGDKLIEMSEKYTKLAESALGTMRGECEYLKNGFKKQISNSLAKATEILMTSIAEEVKKMETSSWSLFHFVSSSAKIVPSFLCA